MRLELLNIPERRKTVAPELVEFFQQIGGDDWTDKLEQFLRSFSGTQFTVPNPQILRDIARDEEIVTTLRRDKTAETRITIMREHKINHTYLSKIWSVCEGTNLEQPPTSSREQAVENAASWMRKFPSLVHDISAIYALSAHEKSKAVVACKAIARNKARATKAK